APRKAQPRVLLGTTISHNTGLRFTAILFVAPRSGNEVPYPSVPSAAHSCSGERRSSLWGRKVARAPQLSFCLWPVLRGKTGGSGRIGRAPRKHGEISWFCLLVLLNDRKKPGDKTGRIPWEQQPSSRFSLSSRFLGEGIPCWQDSRPQRATTTSRSRNTPPEEIGARSWHGLRIPALLVLGDEDDDIGSVRRALGVHKRDPCVQA